MSLQQKSKSKNAQGSKIGDVELVIACQHGDTHAFEMLVKRYERLVSTSLFRLLHDPDDTQDLSQEVFIRVWKSLNQLRDANAFRSWLAHIVTNITYDESKKRMRRRHVVSVDAPIYANGAALEIPDSLHMPDDISYRHELELAVERAISELPDPFRTAIVLRDLQGLSYDEISEATHSTIGTVKSRIARARRKLQVRLSAFQVSLN
ncbi:MAG TPA: sigma-70 family RNA polymerase sigma factor [Candidatus Obscuribacterales bacterium]